MWAGLAPVPQGVGRAVEKKLIKMQRTNFAK